MLKTKTKYTFFGGVPVMHHDLYLEAPSVPRILFLGNGILRLAGGGNWGDLLREIEPPPPKNRDLTNVPFAMQPEAICGVDVEEVQRKTAQTIKDIQGEPLVILQELLSLPFDAILTTNYTYEIETILSGTQWTEAARRKSFVALDGSPHVRNNTCICNMVVTPGGRKIPVFHIHGERLRKHSLVLSYYSYANSVSRLVTLNKKRGNEYQEKQEAGEPIRVLSWLDYFILGEVYAVGFGFDPSEFDIWWAVERKAREKAKHGALHAIMTEESMVEKPHQILFEAMSVDVYNFQPSNKSYKTCYEKILYQLSKKMNQR